MPVIAGGAPKLGVSLLPYTAIFAAEEDPTHPASNLGLYRSLSRTARTLSLGAPAFRIDFGSQKQVRAVFLDGVNSASMFIQTSDSSTFASGVSNWTPSAVAVSADARARGRKKVWIENASPSNHRYMQLLPTGATADGYHYEVATFVAMENFITLSDFLPDVPWVERWQRLGSAFPGGSMDRVGLYDWPALETSIGQDRVWSSIYSKLSTSFEGEVLRLVTRGVGPFVYYANHGSNSEAYLMQRVGPGITVDVERQFVSAPFVMREVHG